jgi:hypothetical protein
MRRRQSEGKVLRQEMESADLRNTAAAEEALAPEARGRLFSAYQALAVRHYSVDREAVEEEDWMPLIRSTLVRQAVLPTRTVRAAAQQRTLQARQEIHLKQAQAVVAEMQMPEAQAQPVAQEHNPEAVAVVVAAV